MINGQNVENINLYRFSEDAFDDYIVYADLIPCLHESVCNNL